MSKVLGILTALILAASCYVATKNKTNYEAEIETRQSLEAKRDKTLRPKLISTTDEKNKTLELKEQKLADAEAEGKKVAAQQKIVDDLKKQMDEKKALVDEQQQKIDTIKEEIKKHGNLTELASEVKALGADLVQLQADIGTSTAKLANLTSEKNRTAAIVSALREENDRIAKNLSAPNLSAQIDKIYDTFGFVVLNAGNNAGVVSGSTLEVVRDGGVVAKLIVKAVEAQTSSAELVPDSLAKDTVLMQGDTVRSAVPKEAPKPAAPTTPAAPAATDAKEPAKADAEAPAADGEKEAGTEEKADAEAPAAEKEEAAEKDPFGE